MDFIFELIAELVFDTVSEASKSQKVPKPVRYILIGLIILFFTASFGLIFLAGALMMKKTVAGGVVTIALGLLMLILSIRKFRKTYCNFK